MLEELDSCQVRDMYYIYLLFWLSRHCGCLFGELPSMYLDQRKMMYVLAKPPAKHREGRVRCDHLVWYAEFAGGAALGT